MGKNVLAEVEIDNPEVKTAVENFMPLAFVCVDKQCRAYQLSEGKNVYVVL